MSLTTAALEMRRRGASASRTTGFDLARDTHAPENSEAFGYSASAGSAGRASRSHWTPWDIGSDSWWKALRQLGVSRADVEQSLADQPEPIDPHHLPCGLEPAQQVALLFVVAWRDPSYAAFMYVPHVWSGVGHSVKEWIVCQYVAFIRAGGERRKQALYSLWVDYFEVDERAAFVYPRLVEQLDREEELELIGHSGPVPWDANKDHYERAAVDPAQHEALAEGLLGSFMDAFGRVDAPEAKRLLDALHIRNERLRRRLAEITEQAAHWRVDAVVTVDRSDERWLRWIPTQRRDEPSFLALMTQLDGTFARHSVEWSKFGRRACGRSAGLDAKGNLTKARQEHALRFPR